MARENDADINENIEADQNEMEIDLLELLQLMWVKKWFLALATFICAAISFAYTFFMVTPMYKAGVMIYVNNNSISLGSAALSISSSDLTAAQKLVSTYIVILESRTTLEEVIDISGLDYTYEQLSAMVSASPVDSTEIFKIEVKSAKPREAQKIANTIAKILPDRIADIVDGSSVRIVDYAVLPAHRDSPSYTKNTTVGAMVGFVLCAAYILFKHLMDNRIKSKAYLNSTYNIPVMAVIPDMNNLSDGSYAYKYYRKNTGSSAQGGER